MNQEPTSPPGKPVLNEESFQHLLASAYTLQQLNIRYRLLIKQTLADCARPLHPLPPLEPALPMAPSDVAPFAPLSDFGKLPETACQPSALAFEPQVRQEVPPDSEWSVRRSSPLPGKLIPLVGPGAPNGMNILCLSTLSRPIVWRAIETLAIAGVFCCLLLSASIHRLSPLPGEPPLSSKMVEQRTPFQKQKPTATVLALSEKPNVSLDRLQSTQRSEADIIAQDTVIRHDKRFGNPRLQANTAKLSRESGSVASVQRTNLEPSIRLSWQRH